MELNKVYQWDTLELMKQIPTGSVDMVLTDPPYNINLQPQRKKTEAIANDNMGKEDFIAFLDSYFSECHRILKDDTFLITFLGWSTIPEFRAVCDKYFTIKSMPVWVKNNFGIGYYTRPQYEPMILYFKGKPPVLENPISDVVKANRVQVPIHSCEKPVELYRKLLSAFTKPWHLVFEGFGGGGNIFVACKELSRNFIGIELEQKYVDITNERLKNVSVSLF